MSIRKTMLLIGGMMLTFGLLSYAFVLLHIQSLSLEVGGWTVHELIRGESFPVYPAIQWAARIPIVVMVLGAVFMVLPICYTISAGGGINKPIGEVFQPKDTDEK